MFQFVWRIWFCGCQGVEHELRSEVWKYLLNYYPWDATQTKRKELRQTKVDDYFRMKLQWRTLCAQQESRFAAYKQRKDLIGNTSISIFKVNILYFYGRNLSIWTMMTGNTIGIEN